MEHRGELKTPGVQSTGRGNDSGHTSSAGTPGQHFQNQQAPAPIQLQLEKTKFPAINTQLS